jgi:hygromycin-B 7''-O-kinase
MLPGAISVTEYTALREQPERWQPLMHEIAAAHGLAKGPIRPVRDGSNLVALLGKELVIKLFPPFMRDQYLSEQATLKHIGGQVGVSTPELVAQGGIGDWPYVVMTQLPGVDLKTVWPSCSEADKCRILLAVGRLIARVQAIPPGPLALLEPAWPAFISQQLERCRRRHEQLGLPQHLLLQIEPYLERTRHVLPDVFPPVVLTGEYTPENLLVTRHGARWQLSGMIDFGDVMVGFSEYDLLGPSTFMASGNAEQLRALFRGFGVDAAAAPGLSERLMRLCLLHRFANFPVQIQIEGWQRSASIEDLGRLLWPVA